MQTNPRLKAQTLTTAQAALQVFYQTPYEWDKKPHESTVNH
jgi:hypothetical protein